jgi:hypothetical protein
MARSKGAANDKRTNDLSFPAGFVQASPIIDRRSGVEVMESEKKRQVRLL